MVSTAQIAEVRRVRVLRFVAAVIGSSLAAVAAVYVLLLVTGEADSPRAAYVLNSAAGFTLLGVLGFLVPLHFGLTIPGYCGVSFYTVPGFLVAAGTTLIMGLTSGRDVSGLAMQIVEFGVIGAFAALVFWGIAIGPKST